MQGEIQLLETKSGFCYTTKKNVIWEYLKICVYKHIHTQTYSVS